MVGKPRCGLVEGNVDRAAGNARILLWNDAQRSQESRVFRTDGVATVDLGEAVGYGADLDRSW